MISVIKANIKSAWQTMPSAGTGTKDDPLYWNETGQAQEGYFYIDLPSEMNEHQEGSVDAWVYGKFEQGQSYDFRAVAMEWGTAVKIYDAENNQVASGNFDDMEYKLVLDFEPETTGIYYFHITCDWAMGEPAIGVNPAPVAITPYIERTAGKAETLGFNEQGRAILYGSTAGAGLRDDFADNTILAVRAKDGLKDLSKNKYTLTPNTEIPIVNNTFVFESVNKFFRVDGWESFDKEHTIEIVFETLFSRTSDPMFLLATGSVGLGGGVYAWERNNGEIEVSTSDGFLYVQNLKPISDKPITAKFVYKGGYYYAFINNTLRGSRSSPNSHITKSSYISIGGNNSSEYRYEGKIYSIRILNYADVAEEDL